MDKQRRIYKALSMTLGLKQEEGGREMKKLQMVMMVSMLVAGTRVGASPESDAKCRGKLLEVFSVEQVDAFEASIAGHPNPANDYKQHVRRLEQELEALKAKGFSIDRVAHLLVSPEDMTDEEVVLLVGARRAGTSLVHVHSQLVYLATFVVLPERIKTPEGAATIRFKQCYAGPYAYLRSSVQAAVVSVQPFVRRNLRDAGESLITVDGVNPIEQALQPVLAAFNAPMHAGIEQEYAKLGLTVSVDRSNKAELEALKDTMWYGDKKANAKRLDPILFLLGTEAYNAWVLEFNK